MAEEHEIDDLAGMWSVKLEGVKRLEAADPEDQEEIYMVDLKLESPSAEGSVSIMVGGGSNETRMIGQAREILQSALTRWADIMARSPGAEQAQS